MFQIFLMWTAGKILNKKHNKKISLLLLSENISLSIFLKIHLPINSIQLKFCSCLFVNNDNEKTRSKNQLKIFLIIFLYLHHV